MEKIKIGFQDKKFEIEVKRIPVESTGLMFVRRKKAKALLFEFKKNVKLSFSSLFVFFPFVILWLDEENNAVDMKKIKPFQWHIPSTKPYCRVLEIPYNKRYQKIVSILVDGKDL